ncbi:MAG TPA: ComEA family DNA-binding protein [Candidatus Latescibacteria bacterium]|nr:ComEA family DNA-binding protein [Candidatus Latescibacterota bacterium]
MFSLTRKEQIVLCLLVIFLVIGGVISLLDRHNPDLIEEFRVIPGTVAPGDSGEAVIPGKLDINAATVEELQTLPGIGPKLAEEIVRFRQENGSFGSVEDLCAVRGIGARTLEGLRPLIKAE